jgi:hypothetical protein
MHDKKLIEKLESFVEQILKDSPLPVFDEKTIKIKNIVIRKSKHGYLIFDTKTKKQIAKTNFKTSAVAIGNQWSKGRNFIKSILELDGVLKKQYSDLVFYENSLKKTNNEDHRVILYSRYDITREKINYLQEKLDRFIFS